MSIIELCRNCYLKRKSTQYIILLIILSQTGDDSVGLKFKIVRKSTVGLRFVLKHSKMFKNEVIQGELRIAKWISLIDLLGNCFTF